MSKKYDIHLESVTPSKVQGIKCLSFGDYPRVVGVSGIYKMVNRFVKCLMTPLGSDLSDLNYGTQLMASFLGNVDTKNIFPLVAQGVAAAQDTIIAYDSAAGLPDDERLASADVQDISVDPTNTGVVFTVVLSNIAGTKTQIQISSLLNSV